MWKKNLAQCNAISAGSLLAGLLLAVLLPLAATANPDLSEARRAVRMQDFTLAAAYYEAAAAQGNAEARHELANLYLRGQGVPRDAARARDLLTQAADQGYAAAQFGLALQLEETDRSGAMALLQLAAGQNYAPAQSYLERMEENSPGQEMDSRSRQQRWHALARNDDVAGLQQLVTEIGDIDLVDTDNRTALHVAVQTGSTAAVEWLLHQHAAPDTRDRFQVSPIADAIRQGNAQLVTRLLTAGVNHEQLAPNGDNLIHLATRQGNPGLLSVLIDAGVPINKQNKDGLSPLDLADTGNKPDLVTLLSAHGAVHSEKWTRARSVDAQSRQIARLENSANLERSDIGQAAQLVISGNSRLLIPLLDARPELLNESLEDGSSLLALAVKHSRNEVARYLLDAGARPDQAIFGNLTPLHLAVRDGNLELVRLLLTHGADPLLRDRDDWDAMEWALTENQPAAATLLAGWLIGQRDGSDLPLPFDHYLLLASQFDNAGVARVLLPYSTGSEMDDAGRNSLWFAASNGNEKLLELLLRAGLNSRADRQGRTPLHVAVQSGCQLCVQQLLQVGNDLNSQTSAGFTPLMIAVSTHNLQMLDLLLQNQANVETRNQQGNTALILAIEQDQVEIVRRLLAADANVTRKNNVGISALDIARTRNSPLYDELREHTVLGLF
ncbi:MAG: ankyrin repeat domain-containing protein [Gammaproteobacteria bacterium]|nr:ankyrin repeat domain-containing protein [Pseudomonadales bacterium]MCP5345833.1 ankyrin repeat domain-containing protein [Pseudomonadales bacterium]